jgi:hypothetical protein
MSIVPLAAAHLFDLNAAILRWLLAAVQPKYQHPRHNKYKAKSNFLSPAHRKKLTT